MSVDVGGDSVSSLIDLTVKKTNILDRKKSANIRVCVTDSKELIVFKKEKVVHQSVSDKMRIICASKKNKNQTVLNKWLSSMEKNAMFISTINDCVDEQRKRVERDKLFLKNMGCSASLSDHNTSEVWSVIQDLVEQVEDKVTLQKRCK